ncbi:MAG: Rid family hydrolase [Clostridium sp.]|nr:Rid family hydrolase [Clostridium sp.]
MEPTNHMIHRRTIAGTDPRIEGETAVYGDTGTVEELHACLRLQPGVDLETALTLLDETVRRLTTPANQKPYTVIWQRIFLSDITNQYPVLAYAQKEVQGARSIIGQSPLNGGKAALWLYAVRTADADDTQQLTLRPGETLWTHNGLTHIWSANLEHREESSEQQTRHILNRYMDDLNARGAGLTDHCVRTWFYVRDIDLHYAGLVKARRELFTANGLTPDTHYIASTGIEGKGSHPHALVHMDAYAIAGLQPAQISYLHAPTHLNPTHEYGVTFERGTAVAYADRTHLFISGTASINNQGEIVHPLNVEAQTRRMWDNVEALLTERGTNGQDIMQAIVYLRDAADYPSVKRILRQQMPLTPIIFVQAPVCRPGWLVEMECIAISQRGIGFVTGEKAANSVPLF